MHHTITVDIERPSEPRLHEGETILNHNTAYSLQSQKGLSTEHTRLAKEIIHHEYEHNQEFSPQAIIESLTALYINRPARGVTNP